MTHVTIQLSSPPLGSRNVKEVIRIKTPEKMFSLGDDVIVETEQENLNTKEICLEEENIRLIDSGLQALPELESRDTSVYTNGITGNEDSEFLTGGEGHKKVVKDSEPMGCEFLLNSSAETHCNSCGGQIEEKQAEAELELKVTRKDLASVQGQLEAFKSRLEEELIERFKLEEELRTETEASRDEIQVLKAKIESLEYKGNESAKRVEELEKEILVYKKEYEKGLKEVEELKKSVSKYQSEVCKLKAEAHTSNDQAVEVTNQMEVFTKKIQKCEHEKEKIKQEMKFEVAGYCKEVQELRNVVDNWGNVEAERQKRIEMLESEAASYKDLVNELREEITVYTNKAKCSDSKIDQNKNDPHVLMLCQELNEIFRENLKSQGKFSELTFVLTATQKELEQARNRNQIQNLALQDFKQKYNDLHDNLLALAEENKHLRNSLEKKCADFRNIRRKFLVSETEVSWLKEALNIVDNAKKNSVCSDVMEITS